MTTVTTTPTEAKRTPGRRIALHVFLWIVALGWLFPIFWALLNSLRDYAYTAIHGYVSFGGFKNGPSYRRPAREADIVPTEHCVADFDASQIRPTPAIDGTEANKRSET